MWRRRRFARRSRRHRSQLPLRCADRQSRSECRRAAASRRCRRAGWSWCTAAAACPCARRASKLTSSGNSCGRSSCSSRKNPCASSSSGVALSSSTWRPRPAIGAIARQAGSPGMAGRAAESLRLVHDEQIDARLHGLVGQLRPLDQHLQGDDGATMHVEGVEVGTEIACHVGEARRIEQREHLVILAPQLAEPLHGQDIGRDDETALDLPGVDEPIQDQRRLDRFPEADFVGEQPAHRIAGASRAPRRRAGAGRAGRVRRGTSPDHRPREAPADAERSAGSRSPRRRRDRPGRAARAARLRAPAATARGQTPCCPFASCSVPSGSRADDRRFPRVSMMRTGRPGLRSTGTSASVLAASRSVAPERGNSTRSARPRAR